MADLSAVVTRILPALGAYSTNELVLWTADELYGWMDEAAKRLARNCGLCAERDTSATITPGTASYATPARHLSTIHVSAGVRALAPTNVQELEALDDHWPDAAAASPERWLHDVGLQMMRLYPAPAAGASGVLALVFHRFPETIAAGSPQLAAPLPLQEYFAFRAIAAARAKETRAQMPDVAAWSGQVADLIEQVAQGYWGGA